MEKSAFKTTLAHGPGQAGGVKEKDFGEKSANAMALKSGTTHGVLSGRGTAGSAVAVLADPITSPGGGMVCARPAHPPKNIPAIKSVLAVDFQNDLGTNGRGDAFLMTKILHFEKES